MTSLAKCKAFGPIVQTPKMSNLSDINVYFERKHNKHNEITRYKTRLVA